MQKNETNPYMLLSVVIAFVNIVFYKNLYVSFMIVLIEVVSLISSLFYKRPVKFFCLYAIYSALALEYEFFAGNEAIYGFRKFDFLGLNVSVWLLFLLFAYLIASRGNQLFSLSIRSRHSFIFFAGILLCFCIGIITGGFNFLLNDNHIIALPGYRMKLIEEIYMFLLPLTVLLCMVLLLSCGYEFIRNIKMTVTAIFTGFTAQILFSYLFGIYGSYGENQTLLASAAIILLPFMIILPFYRVRVPWTCLLLGGISILLEFKYCSSGKYILTMGIVGIIYFAAAFQKRYLLLFLFTAGIAGLIVAGGSYRFLDSLKSNVLFQEKMEQVISMMSFWKEDWLTDMLPSPKIRMLELYNTCLEYLEKPWLLLTGKGIGGSFREHTGIMTFVSDAYSDGEWSNNTFISVHGTFAKLFLANGLIGIGVCVYVFMTLIKYWRQCVWLIPGVYWFLLFYGYSLSMTMVGMSCLMIGLYEIDTRGQTYVHASFPAVAGEG